MIKTKTITKEIQVTDQLFCDNCEAEIPLVFKNFAPDGPTTQGESALRISFDGGYGMYVDSLVQPNVLLWCKTCADGLCKAYPSIAKLIGRANEQ